MEMPPAPPPHTPPPPPTAYDPYPRTQPPGLVRLVGYGLLTLQLFHFRDLFSFIRMFNLPRFAAPAFVMDQLYMSLRSVFWVAIVTLSIMLLRRSPSARMALIAVLGINIGVTLLRLAMGVRTPRVHEYLSSAGIAILLIYGLCIVLLALPAARQTQ